MKINAHLFSTLLVASLLSSCGGGDGGNSNGAIVGNQSDLTPPPSPNENSNGIWLGTLSDSDGDVAETIGFFNDGEYVIVADDFNEFYKGTYSVYQNEISAPFRGYSTFPGPIRGIGAFSGVLSSQGTMLATAETATGTGSLSLDYSSEVYEDPISYADLQGLWSGVSVFFLMDHSMDASGFFTGEVTDVPDGCIATGNMEIPNPTKNIIKANISITGVNCSFTGDFSGLGSFVNSSHTTYFVAFANSTFGFSYIGYRNNPE